MNDFETNPLRFEDVLASNRAINDISDHSDENVSESNPDLNHASYFNVRACGGLAQQNKGKEEQKSRAEQLHQRANTSGFKVHKDLFEVIGNQPELSLLEFNQRDRNQMINYMNFTKTADVQEYYRNLQNDDFVNGFFDNIMGQDNTREVIIKMMIDLF